MSSEICTFVKCMVCMFSGLNTPKLQTSGLTHKGRPFFMTYQTHFLRQYPKSRQSGKSRIVFLYRIRSHRQATVRACCLSGPNMPFGALGMKSLAVQARALALPVTRHCNDTLLSSYDERFPAYFFLLLNPFPAAQLPESFQQTGDRDTRGRRVFSCIKNLS